MGKKSKLNVPSIIKKYKQGYSTLELAKKCKCSDTAIRNQLIKHIKLRNPNDYPKSFKNRMQKVNHFYFDIVNNQEKAYWLGYLFADGNVYVNRSYRLTLCSIDKDSLINYKTALKSSSPIRDRKDIWYHTIYSKHLVTTLISLGVTPHKAHTIKFPKLRKDLVRHFIRGYFDGDGCISSYYSNRYKKTVGDFSVACGSKSFILDLQKSMSFSISGLPINKIIVFKLKDKVSYYTLRYTGALQQRKIYSYFYKHSKVSLKRKRDKFRRIVNIND